MIPIASSSLSHIKVISTVMEDIHNGATSGLDEIDPYGRKVRIFLNLMSFFGDFPATAMFAETIGHQGDSHCTLCTFQKSSFTAGPRILGSVMNHSRTV